MGSCQYLSAWEGSSEKSISELFLLLLFFQEDDMGSSSEVIGLGLCPIPEGCCKPADISSVPSTLITVRIVASSVCVHGFDGARILLRIKLCHFCRNCSKRAAAYQIHNNNVSLVLNNIWNQTNIQLISFHVCSKSRFTEFAQQGRSHEQKGLELYQI